MKNLATALLICFSLAYAQGQESVSQKVVFSSGLHFGEYTSFNMDMQYILGDAWSLRLGRSGNSRKARSQPEDYRNSTAEVVLLFPFVRPEGNSKDRFTNYHLSLGRIFDLNKKGNLRLHLHTGAGIARIKEPTNWRENTGGIFGEFFEDNYEFDTETNFEWSFVLNPRIEYWNSEASALFFSYNLEASRTRTTRGLGLGIIANLWHKAN